MKVGDQMLSSLPTNLYVIATMNTADRSLAVVDFALRRRFTWLTIRPHALDVPGFQEEYFEAFDIIFQKYASDEELNLQPGHSYFLAKDEAEMKERLEYELMPLIKEYINEGYLLRAKDEFSNYFYNKLGVLMYE
jgi:5-methylcytosine-specific restriction protein B